MQIKERSTKILTLLFLMPESRFGSLVIDERLQKIFNLSLNYKTKGTLSALIKSGLIKKNQSNQDQPVEAVGTWSLTEKGFQAVCLEFPFFRFAVDEWDGVWRVISYEIPERKRDLRDRLRREMRGWGLGPWHRSFWLTPHPIIEDLRNLVFGREEEKYVHAFESTHIVGRLDELVEKVWQKQALDKKYRELFRHWHGLLSSEKSDLEKIQQITAYYVELLRFDPGLPKGLIGKEWVGFEAFNLFSEIKKLLLK